MEKKQNFRALLKDMISTRQKIYLKLCCDERYIKSVSVTSIFSDYVGVFDGIKTSYFQISHIVGVMIKKPITVRVG